MEFKKKTIKKNRRDSQRTKLVLPEGVGRGLMSEIGEADQKVQTSSYKA